jgi:pyruvate dehydrogenase E1 component
MYCFRRAAHEPAVPGRRAHLFGSGAIMTQVLEAQRLLEGFGVAADVWSVTSYNELCREALARERSDLLAPAAATGPEPYVSQLLAGEDGVFVAASDYMKSLPLSIARWVPGPYVVLGTDGFGLSESRPDLRDWFEVSAAHIAWAALKALAGDGRYPVAELTAAGTALAIDRDKPDPALAGPATARH